MKLKTLTLVRERVAQLGAIPEIVARRAAGRVQDRLRADATTKRGNVPSFGPHGEVPIRAEASGRAIVVHGPDWVLQKAQDKGQVDGWLDDIVMDETRQAIARGQR